MAVAVFLRRTQWLLDDVAFRVGSGEMHAADVDDVSAALEEVVRLLRETRPDTPTTTPFEHSERTA